MKIQLPEGWRMIEFNDIADKNHQYPIGDGDHGKITPSMYQKNGIPYIRVGDMIHDRISFEKIVYISKETHQNNIGKELIPNDIIIAKTGETIGKVAIIPPEMKQANTTSSIGKITLDKKLAVPRYVLYYMKTPYFRNQMWSVSKKSAQSGFNIKDLKKFNIILPPLSIQQKIVSILEKAEKLKEIRDEVDKLSKDFLKAVFVEMFGDPLRNPKKWNTQKMVDICSLIRDGEHKTPTYVQTGIPFVTATNLIGDEVDLVNTKKITKEEHIIYSKRARPKRDDLLMSKDGTIGVTRTIETDEEFSIFVSVILIKPKRELIDSQYLKQLLSSDAIQKKIREKIKGIAIRHLHLTDLREITIPVPPLAIQKEFATLVNNIGKLQKQQKQSKQNIENLFNSLMQKAFKGELTC